MSRGSIVSGVSRRGAVAAALAACRRGSPSASRDISIQRSRSFAIHAQLAFARIALLQPVDHALETHLVRALQVLDEAALEAPAEDELRGEREHRDRAGDRDEELDVERVEAGFVHGRQGVSRQIAEGLWSVTHGAASTANVDPYKTSSFLPHSMRFRDVRLAHRKKPPRRKHAWTGSKKAGSHRQREEALGKGFASAAQPRGPRRRSRSP